MKKFKIAKNFRHICCKLHLAWHNFWHYQTISTFWYLCIIAARNFAFGSGRKPTIIYEDSCVILAEGAIKLSAF